MASTKPPDFYWESLPDELETLILECVPDHPNTARLASVSQSWQKFWEAKLFRRIALKTPELSAFFLIARGPRRKLVRNIRLEIELPTTTRATEMLFSQSVSFMRSMEVAFHYLSQWQSTVDVHPEGLLLEVDVYDDIFSFELGSYESQIDQQALHWPPLG